MCAAALRQYGIRAVYFGCHNDKFGGTGGVMNIHSEYAITSCWSWFATMLIIPGNSPSVDAPYPVYGGLFREEAIMLLRRFYVQENEKGRPDRTHVHLLPLTIALAAPMPQRKKHRELKTDILPVTAKLQSQMERLVVEN